MMSERPESTVSPSAQNVPSYFDTFEVPMSDVVTQSIEESLAGFQEPVSVPRVQQNDIPDVDPVEQAITTAEDVSEASANTEEFVKIAPPETAESVDEISNVSEESSTPGADHISMEPVVEQTWRQNASAKVAKELPSPAVERTVIPNSVAEPSRPAAVIHASQKSEPVADVVVDSDATGFRALALREEVQQAIASSGYTEPTEIQAQIIPHVLDGRDVLAQSQTGTGKTAAFALPILSRINTAAKKPQVLVLAPTRELAMQVAASFSTYGKHIRNFDVAAVYGGQGYDTQLRQLKRGVPVVVGTPGRVIDHIKRRTLDLSQLECLVLDEADEMLNMGFLDDVKFVLEQTPSTRQVALFSATLPAPIRKIAQQYLNEPVHITVKQKTMTAEAIRQRAVIVQHRDKLDVLSRFLEAEETDGVIVFTKTREATVTVAEFLTREGFSAVALNGDMAQNIRERTISQLKSGRLDVLVATDVAARGLDVSRISHVFNFDLPQDTESYIHRIGRTGRAGRKGEAIVMVSGSQRYKLRQIERLTKQAIEIVRPPTAADINATRVVRFKQQISDVIEAQDLSLFTKILSEYAEESGKPVELVAAALAEMSQKGRSFFVSDRPQRNTQERFAERDGRGSRDRNQRGERSGGNEGGYGGNDSRDRKPQDARRSGRMESGLDRYRIEVGHDDGVKPGNIVGAIANEAGIEGQYIGPINIYDSYSTIDLPEGMPREVHETLQDVMVAGKQLRLRRASEADSQGRSSFRKGPRKGGKPAGFNKRFGGGGKSKGKFGNKRFGRKNNS